MPSGPDLLPEVPPPNQTGDDSELEWLLCLASAFQASQRTTGKDCKDWMLVWRLALRWLGVKTITRPNDRGAA